MFLANSEPEQISYFDDDDENSHQDLVITTSRPG